VTYPGGICNACNRFTSFVKRVSIPYSRGPMGTAAADAPRDPLLERILSDGAPPEDEAVERILAGAVGQLEDFGVRRFTIDDLARRLGISRVTIYRRFAKKSQLLEAVLFYELNRILRQIDVRLAPCETLEERLVEGFVASLVVLRGHRLMNRLLHTEPELILPLLTVHGGPVIAASREFIAGFARSEAASEGFELDEEQLDVLSELLARAVNSFVLTPQSVASLETEEEARHFARRYLAPVLQLMAEFQTKPSA
jgi:AcrR family transcriptional regulator